MPGWALDILYKCIAPLQAEEATWAANGVRAGMMKQGDYSKQIKHWQNAARPIRVVDTAVTIDPKFAAWFEANGLNYRVAPAQEVAAIN